MIQRDRQTSRFPNWWTPLNRSHISRSSTAEFLSLPVRGFDFRWLTLATPTHGTITVSGKAVPFASISGIYFHPEPLFGYDLTATDDEAQSIQAELAATFYSLFAGLKCRAANRIGPAVVAGLPNASQFLERALTATGFRLPAICTGPFDAEAIGFFESQQRRAIVGNTGEWLDGDPGMAKLNSLTGAGALVAVPAGIESRILVFGGRAFDSATRTELRSSRCALLAERLGLSLFELQILRADGGETVLRVIDQPAYESWFSLFGETPAAALAEWLTGRKLGRSA